MTYSYSSDRIVKITGTWLRASAVQAVEKATSGRVIVHLSSGQHVYVGHANGSVTTDDVANLLFPSGSEADR